MKIDSADLSIIPDSRGEETLSATLRSGDFAVRASVPSGKSRGTHEAFVLSPGEAIKKFESVKAKILSVGPRIENQRAFDEFLIALDGAKDKSNLGGNLTLALSLSWARLKAKIEGRELFQYLRRLYDRPVPATQFPLPIMNVVNGGAHAKNNLDFQEFQIIPQAFTFEKAFASGKEVYEKLGAMLKEKYGSENVFLGDEAGYSAPFEDNEEALSILSDLLRQHEAGARLGLDMAANHYFKDGVYVLKKRKYSAEDLMDYYARLIERYKLIFLEDPFMEEAFGDFARLNFETKEKSEAPLIVTDDLTTTNPERLRLAIERNSGSAVIIKPNQIGTLSETIEVAQIAEAAGWKKIVSHRSGETEDDFIADLAYGIGAWGLKAGSPATPYRLSKYERLLAIEKARVED